MKVHYLKCWPMYFDEIQMGRKTFEIRSTVDRIFQAGDQLLLGAFDPEQQMYVGPQQLVDVLAVYHGVRGMMADTCVMSIRLADPTAGDP